MYLLLSFCCIYGARFLSPILHPVVTLFFLPVAFWIHLSFSSVQKIPCSVLFGAGLVHGFLSFVLLWDIFFLFQLWKIVLPNRVVSVGVCGLLGLEVHCFPSFLGFLKTFRSQLFFWWTGGIADQGRCVLPMAVMYVASKIQGQEAPKWHCVPWHCMAWTWAWHYIVKGLTRSNILLG